MSKRRKPKTHTKHPAKGRVFESLTNAAAAMAVPLDVLKLAKKNGCPAFKAGNRIHEAELLKWIEANKALIDAVGSLSLKDKKLVEDIAKVQKANRDADFDFEVKRGRYTENSVLISRLTTLGTAQLAVLRQKIENEMPAATEGMSIAEKRVYGKAVVDAICEKMQGLVVNWKPQTENAK